MPTDGGYCRNREEEGANEVPSPQTCISLKDMSILVGLDDALQKDTRNVGETSYKQDKIF